MPGLTLLPVSTFPKPYRQEAFKCLSLRISMRMFKHIIRRCRAPERLSVPAFLYRPSMTMRRPTTAIIALVAVGVSIKSERVQQIQ